MALYKKHLKNRPNTSALNIWKGLLLTSLQISFKPASDSRFKKELFLFLQKDAMKLLIYSQTSMAQLLKVGNG